MRRILGIAAVAAICLAPAAYAATDAECQDMWKKADVNADGVLSDMETTRYTAAMRIRDRAPPADGRLTQAAFMDSCKADVFARRTVDAGAPLKGANSFTEAQARDRAAAEGYAGVSALAKDADGIWRGTATQDGKTVSIAVDFKGNVVGQPAS
ncbi:MAG: hypothetical protein IPK81_05120 [Rhodospirillales bacterium]|nr:MAG: hypothetical protein IPK81_05120 [Rhodospirillales bacterium]